MGVAPPPRATTVPRIRVGNSSGSQIGAQMNGDAWAVRTQLVMQLAALPPCDLPGEDLGEYRGIRPSFNRWSYVAEICGNLSDRLLTACVEALRGDASPAARQAQSTIDMWREARAAGKTPPRGKLPGLVR
jgi:hypothetical protein